MAEHSKYFSPSALALRIACPGSALLEDKLPVQPSGCFARWGTAAHYVCEQCRKSGGDPQQWVGKSAPVEEGDKVVHIKIDQAMVKSCALALAMMRKITKGHTVETETRVELPDLPDMFGTVDVLVNEPPLLIVCDYKFGDKKVEAENNPQLMAYALMAAGENLQNYTEIRLAIIQPKVNAVNAAVWHPTTQELIDWRDKTLMPTIEAIRSGKPEYRPGKECAWCPGKRDCPALAASRKKPA